jgi:hypothetical protein
MAIVIKLVKNEDGDEDMVLEDGAIQMCDNGTAAAVQMKERLLCDKNEAVKSPLVKDTAIVMDWEGIIFDNSTSRAEKELELKRVILGTPGMQRITYWKYEQVGRTLVLDYKVESEWGELEFGETVQL